MNIKSTFPFYNCISIILLVILDNLLDVDIGFPLDRILMQQGLFTYGTVPRALVLGCHPNNTALLLIEPMSRALRSRSAAILRAGLKFKSIAAKRSCKKAATASIMQTNFACTSRFIIVHLTLFVYPIFLAVASHRVTSRFRSFSKLSKNAKEKKQYKR